MGANLCFRSGSTACPGPAVKNGEALGQPAGAVVGAVMVFRDVSATRALTHRLAYSAQHDSLTDLPNRLLLNDLFTKALMMAKRHNSVLAVLYMDLDRFKHIDDSVGHAVGDRVLRAIALRLIECVRASDTVCRLGGDEFVIVLSEVAHAEDAAVCAEKMLESLAQRYVRYRTEDNGSSLVA
jgi:diguanylate cyclase (GGDEF)-like protein